MNTYRVVIPLHRWENFPAIDFMLQKQEVPIKIDLLISEGEMNTFLTKVGYPEDDTYTIHFINMSQRGSCAPGNYKFHQWMKKRLRDGDSEEYICFLNDDDYYEPGFFKKLEGCDARVMVTSMKRGDAIHKDTLTPHPTWTLIADPANLKFGHVGLEQVLFKSVALRESGIVDNDEIEATLIKLASANFARYFMFAYILFNYLERGRYTK